ncbi:hypothetical protein BV22DRAFT_562631 [Leucogyrophana mollusca]|uniref:Uncharacterized protein n=1 Tax=Leucogyrophana mollusca TaxID=85980 RepID=A0ACB8BG28_9AGAM|nr:hypothetical protein BV22DRAFT_562631 [Leucogyrophana mollusca]
MCFYTRLVSNSRPIIATRPSRDRRLKNLGAGDTPGTEPSELVLYSSFLLPTLPYHHRQPFTFRRPIAIGITMRVLYILSGTIHVFLVFASGKLHAS